MDLDLVSNGSAIKNSINALNNGNISWIVLGYTSNKTINVIESGGDSFEDMFEEFDSNKIMYGFAAVIDPNTKLKKNVFIHWQGEAASQSMKTMSVQHSNIIRDICKPVHVTITARDEQDLDLNEIMTKVASASGSNYSCHNETKQVYQHLGSVKSEENTAQTLRQNRLKELSDLGNLQKEVVPDQHINSTYEKVNAQKEIQNYRNKAPEVFSPAKPMVQNYVKIDASKEIKSQAPNRITSPYQSVGTNYVKIDAAKEIKSSTNNVPVSQNLPHSYKKINPEQEFKSLNLNQKTMFENKAKVQSENNTAEKAKEERQKEISNLFSKRINYDDDADRRVGTNYTRVNPVAEIKKLRSASITQDNVDMHTLPSSTYKKIDPAEEFSKIRRMSSSDQSEPKSPTTNYRKINPAEEIKKLKSQSTFEDVRSPVQSYKKINPIEEIHSVKKLSSPFVKTETERTASSGDSRNISQTNTDITPKVVLSARQTFENSHKANHDVHQTHTTKFTQESRQRQPEATNNNTRQAEPIKESPVFVKQAPPVIEEVKFEPVKAKITPVESITKNTAEAQFQYDATDTDEISFVEGEIIRNIEVIDDDWWLGVNAAGKTGLFPSNYVMSCNVEQLPKKEHHAVIAESDFGENNHQNYDGANKDSPMAAPTDTITIPSSPVAEKVPELGPISDISAIAVYDYEANDNDEISFDVGELLTEIEQIDDGWWVGVNKAGIKGMFPSNFVELTSTNQSAAVSDSRTNESSKVIDLSSCDSVTVRALYDYCAQGDDEVSFRSGDIIGNVEKVDVGWWEGDVADGRRGLFPSNYVESL